MTRGATAISFAATAASQHPPAGFGGRDRPRAPAILLVFVRADLLLAGRYTLSCRVIVAAFTKSPQIMVKHGQNRKIRIDAVSQWKEEIEIRRRFGRFNSVELQRP